MTGPEFEPEKGRDVVYLLVCLCDDVLSATQLN
jgi:hypothetical protein